ncbi:MAG: hypothetical protein RRC07_02050, partial [Anaerolineae bacterium]|nr:hypothetical protein [Anaerolineae bacterium]
AVRYLNRKYNLDYSMKRTAIVPEPDRRGMVRWQDHATGGIDARSLESRPAHGARFAGLDEPLSDEKVLRALESDFQEWIYRDSAVTVRANEALAVYVGPEVAKGEFAEMCQKAAVEKASAEADKVEAQFARKVDSLKTKLSREERELEQDKAEYSQRKMQEAATHAETLFSLFSKRRRSVSSSMTKRRMTARAADDVKESEEEIARLKKDIDKLEAEMKAALDDLEEKWNDIAADTTEIKITPYKKDIHVELFGVAWMPHHMIDSDGRLQILPGFHTSEEQ